MKQSLLAATVAVAALLAPAALPAEVTAPAAFFAQAPGTDYFLADYTAYEAYLKKVAGQSDRIKLVDIGKSAEGRTMWMAIVSSPANLARLDHYREISARLARAKGLTDDQAHALAAEGKAVVWIDAGLHATETVTSQGQIQVLHRMLTDSDPETLRLLDDCIILFAQVNPDGMELVADWYMRTADPKKREFDTIPRLYEKYAGHDDNRDSFMAALPETENVNRVMFREWYPQILYNQHQTGPAGMVVFVPPFRDPFNFNYDPIVISELSEVGAAMHSRLISEGKAGSGMRSAAPYSTWHNGMERSVAYFHNSVGLLTEIIGGPTPSNVQLVPATQLPRNDEPLPVAPQPWHLQQTLDYQWSLNRAVLDYASRNRERLLFGIYKMGANSIARGSRDSWTTTPVDVDELQAAVTQDKEAADKDAAERAKAAEAAGKAKPATPPEPSPAAIAASSAALYDKVLRAPEKRDPRGYVIPADQADLPTAITFLNALIKAGIEVERATAPFAVAGKSYPAGSFVVRTAQAYRPHVLDMFESQDHPHDLEYPGGPPKAPYDITGYTLAYQMGISFDRVMDGFDGPFAAVPDLIAPPPGAIVGSGKAGWIVDHATNNSFILANRLLKAKLKASWLRDATQAGGKALAPGALWIPASRQAQAIVTAATGDLGLTAYAVGTAPAAPQIALKPVRIGLVDRYGGAMPAGWTRLVLEKFEFPFTVVYPQRLDAGNLKRDYDVLLFADSVVPGSSDRLFGTSRLPKQPALNDTPPEYRAWLGNLTDDKSVPAIDQFARAGGTVVAVGSSARLATLLRTSVEPALVEDKDGTAKPIDRKSFYIPGSILRVKVDNRQPLAFGMPEQADIFFDENQTFHAAIGDAAVRPVAWFDQAKVLRSGWAVGQERLRGTIAVADVDVGRGKLFVMGPEVNQRAQSYGTFKLLFNGLLYGPAVSATR